MMEAMSTLAIPGDEQYLHINPKRSEWPVLPATASLAGIGVDAYHAPSRPFPGYPGCVSGTATGARLGA